MTGFDVKLIKLSPLIAVNANSEAPLSDGQSPTKNEFYNFSDGPTHGLEHCY